MSYGRAGLQIGGLGTSGVNSIHPLAVGLVAWLKLDEASGVRYDAVGSRHLDDVATVESTTGKIGTAAQFTYSPADRLKNEDALGFSNQWTLFCWVKGTSGSTRGFMNLGGGFWPNGATATLYTNDGSQLTGVMGNTVAGDYSLNQNGQVALNNDEWHFCVGRFNLVTGLVEIAVDNNWDKLNSIEATAPTINAPSGIYVGSYHITLGPTDYAIDEAAIYNRLLSDDEITTMYNSGAGRTYPF